MKWNVEGSASDISEIFLSIELFFQLNLGCSLKRVGEQIRARSKK